MISRLFRTATLGRVIGFTLVVIYAGMLASPYLQQGPDPGPDAAGPLGPVALGKVPGDHLPPGARVVPVEETFVGDDVSVAFAVRPVTDPAGLTDVTFTLEDGAGQPITPPSPPAVWIGRKQSPAGSAAAEPPGCEDRIKAYVRGTFDARPEIDLTSYFVMALNDDASISVIDPLNGIAGVSQLFAMVPLTGRGEDWVLTGDGRRLFVSIPAEGTVTVVDTDEFAVVGTIDVAGTPMRMALSPDGRTLWVADDTTDGAPGGVTVIDVATQAILARLRTGAGEHEIVFSGHVAASHENGHPTGTGQSTGTGTDDAATYVFVSNSEDGTVAIVDARRLEIDATVSVGAHPGGLDVASASGAVYVPGGTDGGLTVIDSSRREIVGRVRTSPGVELVRFAPGGRWGFAVSPASDSVDVIDATTNRVVHVVRIPGAPDRVSFSATHAFVHASERSDVAVIDLAQVGGTEALEAVTVIGGETPPARSPVQLAVADPIVPVHGHGSHVLIANPGDRSIYDYMEGMSAPMGALTNYGRAPRAVIVVDRSIQPTAPGVFAARVRVPGGGSYEAALLLDSPRVVHCFTFTADADPSAPGPAGVGALGLRLLSTGREVTAGESLAVRVALVDARTNAPVSGIADLQVIATLASGRRSERFTAAAAGPGTYEARLLFAVPGTYNVYFTVPSRGVGVGDLPSITVRVTPDAPG